MRTGQTMADTTAVHTSSTDYASRTGRDPQVPGDTAKAAETSKQAMRLFNLSKNKLVKIAQWYRDLGEQEREFLNLITVTAIEDYLEWANLPEPIDKRGKVSADHLFSIAPIETARAISLSNVLEVTRTVVDIITENIGIIAPKGKERDYYEAALYYSREVSFSAAEVYAEVAETRSRWMTREEGLVLNSLLENKLDLALQSRMGVYGWDDSTAFFAAVGSARAQENSEITTGFFQAQTRLAVQGLDAEILMGTHTNTLFMVLVGAGSSENFDSIRTKIANLFSEDDCLCIGPYATGYEGASHSIRAAYNGYYASAMELDPPHPLFADDIIADRVLFGDATAADQLYSIYRSLEDSGKRSEVLPTVEYYLLKNCSLEQTAEHMVVHPNTVRYRLHKAMELTGWDPTNPKEAHALRIAIKIGRYREARSRSSTYPRAVPQLGSHDQ